MIRPFSYFFTSYNYTFSALIIGKPDGNSLSFGRIEKKSRVPVLKCNMSYLLSLRPMHNNQRKPIRYMLSAVFETSRSLWDGTTMTTRSSSKYYFPLSAIIFLFYFAWAAALGLASQWLGQILHLSPEVQGTFFTANAIGAMLFQPIYGAIQDRLGVSKKLLVWIGLVLALCWPIMGYLFVYLIGVSHILAMVVSGAFIALGILAAAGVVDSYCERVGRNAGVEYGKVRVWGAIGWCISTLIVGHYAPSGFWSNLPYIACTIAGVLLLIVLFNLDDKGAKVASVPGQEQQVASLSDSLVVLKEFKFWRFAIFLFGIAGLYFLFDQQFQAYYASYFHNPVDDGAGTRAYAQLYSSETIIEAVFLPFMPWIVNRLGARNGLVVAALLMGLRILLTGIITDKWVLTACFLTRGFEIPLLLVSVFKFMEGVYDPRFSSTIYLIAFQFAQQFCSICFAKPVGNIISTYNLQAPNYGYQVAYICLGIFGLVFMLWGLIMLPRPKKGRVNPQPMESITPAVQ